MSHRYDFGQRVQIADRDEPRHHRVPRYVRGATGVITECLEPAPIPEQFTLSHQANNQVPVYRVRVAGSDLWNDSDNLHRDTLEIEVYEHWLDEA